jgi:hypothetical protein
MGKENAPGLKLSSRLTRCCLNCAESVGRRNNDVYCNKHDFYVSVFMWCRDHDKGGMKAKVDQCDHKGSSQFIESSVMPKMTGNIHAIAHFDFDGSCRDCPCLDRKVSRCQISISKFTVKLVPDGQRHELCPLCIEGGTDGQ